MYKYYNIIRSIAFVLCIYPFFWGCDKQAEPPPKPKVITKKIIARKDVSLPPKTKPVEAKKPTPEAEVTLAQAPKPKAVTIVKPVPKPKTKTAEKQVPKPKVAIAPQQAPAPEIAVAEKPAAKTTADIMPSQPDMQDKKPVASLEPELEKALMSDAAGVYSPIGKLDPFAPLFQEKQTTPIISPKAKAKRVTPLTPLEKVDLSQLELVGIILAQSGNKAMVKETSGKGYVVKKGTPIGNRSGKIVEILTDRIIVEEQIEDIYGKISVKKRSLQIQKPLGE